MSQFQSGHEFCACPHTKKLIQADTDCSDRRHTRWVGALRGCGRGRHWPSLIVGPNGCILEAMATRVIHISETEAASDFASLLERVRERRASG
jgi:hypothetical protein